MERTAALERSCKMTNEEKRAAFHRLSHTPGIRTGQDYADSLLNKDRMQVGDLLEWTIDGEPGTILALSDLAIAIQWEKTGIEWYSVWSGALARIKPVTQHSELPVETMNHGLLL
jgi:hypothetical protein